MVSKDFDTWVFSNYKEMLLLKWFSALGILLITKEAP